jgi:hypothetical protein
MLKEKRKRRLLFIVLGFVNPCLPPLGSHVDEDTYRLVQKLVKKIYLVKTSAEASTGDQLNVL